MNEWMNEWCFRPQFCTCKAILGWGQPGLRRWIYIDHSSVLSLYDETTPGTSCYSKLYFSGLSLFYTLSHCLLLFYTLSHCILLFYTLSHCLLLFYTLFHWYYSILCFISYSTCYLPTLLGITGLCSTTFRSHCGNCTVTTSSCAPLWHSSTRRNRGPQPPASTFSTWE